MHLHLTWIVLVIAILSDFVWLSCSESSGLWQWGGFLGAAVVDQAQDSSSIDTVILASYPPLQGVRIAGTACDVPGQVGFMKIHRSLALEAAHRLQAWTWFRCSVEASLPGTDFWVLSNVTLLSSTTPFTTPIDALDDLYTFQVQPTWGWAGSLCLQGSAPAHQVTVLSTSSIWIRHTYVCTRAVSYESGPSWFPVEPHYLPLSIYQPIVSMGLLQFSGLQLALPTCTSTIRYGESCTTEQTHTLCGYADIYPNVVIQWQCIRGSVVFNPDQGCGDGILQTDLGEQCDDGNVQDADGCDATCQIESNALCEGSEISTCECAEGFQQTALGCLICAPRFWGPICLPCPAWCAPPFGICQDGTQGSGECVCMRGYTGPHCTDCAPGFHAMGGRCMACSSSMCSPYGHCTGNADTPCYCIHDNWVGAQCDVPADQAEWILATNPLLPVVCPADACGPHADCAGSLNVARMTDLLKPLPYYRCTCQTGWTGHQCQVCQTGYVGPLCERCRACSIDSWLLCTTVPNTTFGSYAVWKTPVSGTLYICPGDDSSRTLSVAATAAAATATSAAQMNDLGPMIPSNAIAPPTLSWQAKEPRLDTRDHALILSRSTILPWITIQKDVGRYPQTQVWRLARTTTETNPLVLVHMWVQSLRLWSQIVSRSETENLRVHCITSSGEDPMLTLPCIVAANLVATELSLEPPLIIWNNASLITSEGTQTLQCRGLICTTMCLTTLASDPRTYITDALCPDICVCSENLDRSLDWTYAFPTVFGSSGSIREQSDEVEPVWQNAASLNRVDQLWKPRDPLEWDVVQAQWINDHSDHRIRISTRTLPV